MMNRTRPIVCFDLEATDSDPAIASIFQFAGIKTNHDDQRDGFTMKCKPWKGMSPGASEATGVKDEDLANEKPFKDYAARVHAFVAGCDLIGFNLSNYDVPLLWEEFHRCGIVWDLTGIHVIDAGTLFKIRERRDLTAAMQFYCGQTHEGAHDAMADVDATMKVLQGQRERYPDLKTMDVAQLAAATKYEDERRVDLAGKIVLDKEGHPVYNFGKAKGVRVLDDTGFGWWMMKNNFSQQTKMILGKILDGDDQNDLFK